MGRPKKKRVAYRVLNAAGEVLETVYNVNSLQGYSRPAGNSVCRALRALRTHAPDLHARVIAKELSPHAAMVKAGLRPRTMTLRLDDLDLAAQALRKRLSDEDALWFAYCFQELLPPLEDP